MATTNETGARRQYHRRTDEERIAELQRKIEEIRMREAARSKKKEDPVLREIPKVQRRLKKFSELAAKSGRLDLVNSVTAFVAALERTRRAEVEGALRPARDLDDEPELA